jgi:hypothetical protein
MGLDRSSRSYKPISESLPELGALFFLNAISWNSGLGKTVYLRSPAGKTDFPRKMQQLILAHRAGDAAVVGGTVEKEATRQCIGATEGPMCVRRIEASSSGMSLSRNGSHKT